MNVKRGQVWRGPFGDVYVTNVKRNGREVWVVIGNKHQQKLHAPRRIDAAEFVATHELVEDA